MASPGHPRILAIQLRRLGDLVLATPAFRALKARFPEGRLVVLTESPFDEVLLGISEIDEVLLHPRGALRSAACGVRLGLMHWDMAFDFHGNPTSARLTAQSGAAIRIGFALRGRRIAYTKAVPLPPVDPPRYTADMKLDLVRAAGIPVVDATPRIHVSPEERESARDLLIRSGVEPDEPLLIVAPASRRAYKRWSLKSFSAVIRDFRSAVSAPVVLVGGPGEESILASVSGMTSPGVPVIRAASIRSLMAILDRGAVFAGVDGGAKQLAQALGLPSLALFGPQNPAVWTNRSLPHAVIRGRKKDCTVRCSAGEGPCTCLAEVTPSEVSAKLIALWEESSRAGRLAGPHAGQRSDEGTEFR